MKIVTFELPFRSYRYDPTRATARETLPAILKRCKLEDREEPGKRAKKGIVNCLIEDKPSQDSSEPVARFTAGGTPITIALNLITTAITDFRGYRSASGNEIFLYPDHMLAQAEDAYGFYISRRVEPMGFYSPVQLEMLKGTRRYRKAIEEGTPIEMKIPFEIIPLVLQIGLEDREYAKWNVLGREEYVDRCIMERAISYMFNEFVYLDLAGREVDMKLVEEFAYLAEIGYGPIPLARLGELCGPNPDMYHKLLKAVNGTRETDILYIERERIVKAARKLVSDFFINKLGIEYDASFWHNFMRDVKTNLLDITPLYFVEEKEDRRNGVISRKANRNGQGNGILIKESPLTPDIRIISKPPLDGIIEKFKSMFAGNPTEFLTALHEMAKPKDLYYLMDHPETLKALILNYRRELEKREFDIDSVIREMNIVEEKSERKRMG